MIESDVSTTLRTNSDSIERQNALVLLPLDRMDLNPDDYTCPKPGCGNTPSIYFEPNTDPGTHPDVVCEQHFRVLFGSRKDDDAIDKIVEIIREHGLYFRLDG